MATETTGTITITPPNFKSATFHIVGTAPLMTARFSKKQEIMESQAAGKTAKKKAHGARDFEADGWAAAYVSRDGWYGVHAAAFRNAAIRACSIANFKMTLARLSIFVDADGYDREEGTPLVRVIGEPSISVMPVRNQTGVLDLRARPVWAPGWEAHVKMRWDGDQFTINDVTNLMARVGMQVGIGEGRPASRDGNGIGYGLFDVPGVTPHF